MLPCRHEIAAQGNPRLELDETLNASGHKMAYRQAHGGILSEREDDMLIKEAEDPSEVIAALEARAAKPGANRRGATANLARRKAGFKGEAESTYFINFDFADSPNWAVLHDLRLEHGSRTAQIDHLLINRWMEFFVLETKHFRSGIKITDDGEFLRWNDYKKRYEGMASPLQQNERHIAVLSDVIREIELPSRLGFRIAPTFHSLVLVAPSAIIMRPERLDTSNVIKADQLKPRIWREIDGPNPVAFLLKSAARLVSSEAVEFVGRRLAALHRKAGAPAEPVSPVAPASPSRSAQRIEPTLPTPPSATPTKPGPSCKECQGRSGNILYGRYGYYFKCDTCEANTAIRFTCKPGHKPRLRKAGHEFHRDCAECGTSSLFHRNREDPTA